MEFQKTPLLSNLWKQSVLFGAGTIYMLGLLAFAFLFANRNYPPIKAKQIELLFGVYIFGGIWQVGVLHALGAIDWVGIFNTCIFWDIWVQCFIGNMGFLTLLHYRMNRLYCVLVDTKAPKGFKFWFANTMVFVPSLIVCTWISLKPPGSVMPISPLDTSHGCTCDPFFKYLLFCVLAALVIWMSILNIKLYHIAKPFNEVRENNHAFLISALCLCTVITMSMFKIVGTLTGNTIVIVLQMICFHIVVWFPLAKPFWGCYAYPKRYLQEWQAVLHK
ncbi:hypothetical protein EDD86DRAFT_247478 [Gorgonomyces haynaldii]|nr:hypothetical protein EDD86DRAFT_247478 [Gorgonomyces haynaldii]